MKYKLAIVFIFAPFWVFSETSLVFKISENVITFARDRSGNCSFQNLKIWIFLCYGFMYIVRDLAAMTKSLFLAFWLISQISRTGKSTRKQRKVVLWLLLNLVFLIVYGEKQTGKTYTLFLFLNTHFRLHQWWNF